MIKCPLCGYEFDESISNNTCQGCPMHGKCNLTRCPNCGYDIPRPSRILRVMKALRRSSHEPE